MKEQIKAIIYKYTYHGGTDGVPMTIDVEKIAEEIDKLYHSNDKLDKIDKQGGWICPRCQKVHSWLSMTCDCEPKTITSITY